MPSLARLSQSEEGQDGEHDDDEAHDVDDIVHGGSPAMDSDCAVDNLPSGMNVPCPALRHRRARAEAREWPRSGNHLTDGPDEEADGYKDEATESSDRQHLEQRHGLGLGVAALLH
jgi:hypothetical protein